MCDRITLADQMHPRSNALSSYLPVDYTQKTVQEPTTRLDELVAVFAKTRGMSTPYIVTVVQL